MKPQPPTGSLGPSRRSRARAAPGQARSASHPANHTTLWHLLLLTAATLGLYAAALRDGFVTDDITQLLENPFITSYRNIPRLFATNVWALPTPAPVTSTGRCRCSSIWWSITPSVFIPWLFHLVNLLAGVAGVIVVYFLVRALARDGGIARSASLALGAALLFALHPVHVEPMVWISALPDLLCGLFLFTAMLFYHRARTGPRPLVNHALATASYFAALFCKETAMVFPALAAGL